MSPATGERIFYPTKQDLHTVNATLEIMECPVCGIMYAAPQALIEWSRQKPHRAFYCPRGDELHFPGKTEAQKLQEKLDRERARSGNLASRLEQTEASRRAQKAATTRLKRRVANGVCPCCQRTFKDLAAHIETKHPDFKATA